MDFVGHVVDPQTGNIPVRVLVENPAKRLCLGQTAAVAITVRPAVQRVGGAGGSHHRLGRRSPLERCPQSESMLLYPQLGLKDQGWVEIIGIDLKPGESVVVEGNYNLPDDTPVIAKPGNAKP